MACHLECQSSKRFNVIGVFHHRGVAIAQVEQLSRRMEEGVWLNLAGIKLLCSPLSVEEDNDAILVELCDRLEQRVGVSISRATFA